MSSKNYLQSETELIQCRSFLIVLDKVFLRFSFNFQSFFHQSSAFYLLAKPYLPFNICEIIYFLILLVYNFMSISCIQNICPNIYFNLLHPFQSSYCSTKYFNFKQFVVHLMMTTIPQR